MTCSISCFHSFFFSGSSTRPFARLFNTICFSNSVRFTYCYFRFVAINQVSWNISPSSFGARSIERKRFIPYGLESQQYSTQFSQQERGQKHKEHWLVCSRCNGYTPIRKSKIVWSMWSPFMWIRVCKTMVTATIIALVDCVQLAFIFLLSYQCPLSFCLSPSSL